VEFLTKQPGKYSWNAEDYAKNSSVQFEWAKEIIPKLKLTGNEMLLDIGCGDGKITAQIATAPCAKAQSPHNSACMQTATHNP